MKKLIIPAICFIFAIALGVLFLGLSNHYSLDAKVVERNNQTITFEDTTGNLWEYVDENDEYLLGDLVKLTWNDKGTETKTDDEIIEVKVR